MHKIPVMNQKSKSNNLSKVASLANKLIDQMNVT